jgi:hypothetical protein
VSGSGTLLSLLVFPAGLANVVYPVAVFLRLAGQVRSWAFQRLRVYIPLLAASSWLAFVALQFIPREGHVMWLAGIVATLFPEEVTARIQKWRVPNPQSRHDSAN